MTPPAQRPARRSRSGLLAGAPVTQAIVIVTVACWLVDLLPGVELGMLLGFTPVLAATEPWRALTVMLVHADLMHLGFNMMGVLLFGGFVERSLGHARYLAVYVLSGLAGSAAVLLFAHPIDPSWYAMHVGASGALFGLLGVVLTPTRALDRNWGGAAGFLVINVVYSLISPGISWESHLGGLVMGFALGCAALLPGSRARKRALEEGRGQEVARGSGAEPEPAAAPENSSSAGVVPSAGAGGGLGGGSSVRTPRVGLWFWAAAVILVVVMVVAVLPGLRASLLMAG